MKKTLIAIAILGSLASCSKKVSTASFQQTQRSAYVSFDDDETLESSSIEDALEISNVVKNTLVEEDEVVTVSKEEEAFKLKVEGFKARVDAINSNENLSKKEIRLEKKALKKDIKHELKEAEEAGLESDYAFMMVVSILIAPVGLGILYGWGSKEFWIGLVLFLLFWIPGAIYGGLKAHESLG